MGENQTFRKIHTRFDKLTCSVLVESKMIFVDSGRGAFQTSFSISASIDGTTIPVSGAIVGALKAYQNSSDKTIHKSFSVSTKFFH